MDDLRSRIRRFIATEVMLHPDPSVVTEETTLIGGVMDSLGLMQLVSYLQDEFGVRFDEEEIVPQNFRTVADVERLVSSKLVTRAASGMSGTEG